MKRKKVCVVAGGVKGQGSLLIEEYAGQGCTIAVMDMDKQAGRELKERMESRYGIPVFFFHGDLSSEEDVELFAGAIIGQYESADYLFYHAGAEEAGAGLPRLLSGHLNEECIVKKI